MKTILKLFLLLWTALPSFGLDENQNGMSDVWERMYSITPDGFEDADGDGASNIDEYLAGTNPRDVNSKFRIGEVTRSNDGVYVTVSITWNAIVGYQYDLESTENITSGYWHGDGYYNSSTTGPTTFEVQYLLDDYPNGLDQKFYRVRVSPSSGLLHDSDGDGLTNAEEALLGLNPDIADMDGDGFDDGYDWFYMSATVWNDWFADPDGDGLASGWEYYLRTNPLWWDSDGDGMSDWEEDMDNDNRPNGHEIGGWYGFATDPTNSDSDNDEMGDGWELYYHYLSGGIGFNPLAWNDPEAHSDGDGLSDGEEYQWNTNPLSGDTDNDEVSDLVEINNATNPSNASSKLPPPGGTCKVTVELWDDSGSGSEKWQFRAYPIASPSPNDPVDTVPMRVRTNKQRGVQEWNTLTLVKGVAYRFEVVHKDSSLRTPDYDYYLDIWSEGPPKENEALLIKDPQRLLGTHRESKTDWTKGKEGKFVFTDLTSKTDATVPADRSRLLLGVGERLEVKLSLRNIVSEFGPVTWSVAGGNTWLVPSTARFITMIAGDEAHEATVTAEVAGKRLSLKFNVMIPTGIKMARWPDTSLFHMFGIPSCGMQVSVEFLPRTVSFTGILLREGGGNAIADGFYKTSNGDPHPGNRLGPSSRGDGRSGKCMGRVR
jgi:Bacterial TSP3 repeat